MSKSKPEIPEVPQRALFDFSLLISGIKDLASWLAGWFWPTVGITLAICAVSAIGYAIYWEDHNGFISHYKWYAVNDKGVEFELFSSPTPKDFTDLQDGKCVNKTSFPLVLKPGQKSEGPFYYLLSYENSGQREDRNNCKKYFLCFTDRVELERKN